MPFVHQIPWIGFHGFHWIAWIAWIPWIPLDCMDSMDLIMGQNFLLLCMSSNLDWMTDIVIFTLLVAT